MNFNNSDFAKGAQEIAEKLRSLTFQTIAHTISTMDIQPTYDNCILIVVTGALKVNLKKIYIYSLINYHILFRRIMIHRCNLLKHFFCVLLIIHGL